MLRAIALCAVTALLIGGCGDDDATTSVSGPPTTAAAGESGDDDALLSLQLETDGGPAGGPIHVTATVSNVSDQDLVVLTPYFTPNLVRFTLVGEDGAAVPFDGPYARLEPAGEERFVTLSPGESTSETFDLTEHFTLSPGAHEVSAEYRNPPGASHEGDRAVRFAAGEGPTAGPVPFQVTP